MNRSAANVPHITFSSKQMSAGGCIIRVRSTSNDKLPRVVLVHGIGVSSAYFELFARVLAGFYTVTLIDLPGYGKTPKPDRTLTIEELSKVVADFMQSDVIEDSVLIGHSMGCQVVANLVKKYPKLCSKFILISPTVYDKERSIKVQAWRLLQDTFREPVSLNLRIVRDYVRMGMRRYVQTSRYMMQDTIEEVLPLCPIPGLIVRGERDPIVPHEWAERLSSCAPNARYVEIANSPHVVHYKNARELAYVCKVFIRK